MYSKEIEEVIDAALLVGIMTDNVRNALRSRAEAEGEDADEVIMVAEMRLKQNPNGDKSKVDKKSIGRYVMSAEKEIEWFESNGYQVYKTDKGAKKYIEVLINDYNTKARAWNYSLIEVSRAMKEDYVFFTKFKEEYVFDPDADDEPMETWEEMIANADFNFDTLAREYRKGILQGVYDSIIALAKPYK